jgi:hypothetical protein
LGNDTGLQLWLFWAYRKPFQVIEKELLFMQKKGKNNGIL